MSHPENTLKEIIKKRDEQIRLLMGVIGSHEKKIKSLIKIFELYISTLYGNQRNLDMEQCQRFLKELDEVRKL